MCALQPRTRQTPALNPGFWPARHAIRGAASLSWDWSIACQLALCARFVAAHCAREPATPLLSWSRFLTPISRLTVAYLSETPESVLPNSVDARGGCRSSTCYGSSRPRLCLAVRRTRRCPHRASPPTGALPPLRLTTPVRRIPRVRPASWIADQPSAAAVLDNCTGIPFWF